MADSIYIQSVSITPNPVTAGGKIKIEVEIYPLYPHVFVVQLLFKLDVSILCS